MIDPELEACSEGEADPKLAKLAAWLARRIQAGEQVDVDDYVRRYPKWAKTIQKLLPAIRDLTALGRALPGGSGTSSWY